MGKINIFGISMSRRDIVFLALLVFLTFFLRFYNTSDLSGGDDSQWLELATYAIQDPKIVIYPHQPDLPVAWRGMVYNRPFSIIPFMISILLFGHNRFAAIFPVALFSALSAFLLFRLVRKFFDRKVAFLACFFFAINPFQIAFSRIPLLDASLIFTALLAFSFLIEGLEKKRVIFIYLSALVWLINITTTDIRGAVPILAVIPCVFFFLMKGKADMKHLKGLLKDRLFHHLLFAYIGIVVVFAVYITLPVLWGRYDWLNSFFDKMLKHSIGLREDRVYPSFFEAVAMMGPLLIFTPFIGLIFMPFLSGLVIFLKNLFKFRYAFWFFYLAGIVFFYTQGQYSPMRQTIFIPAIVTIAAVGLVVPYYDFVKNRSTVFLPLVLALCYGYPFVMLFGFSRLFAEDFNAIFASVEAFKMGGVIDLLLSYWWVFSVLVLGAFALLYFLSRKKSLRNHIFMFYRVAILFFVLLNLSVSALLVHTGAGIYKRTTYTSVVGEFLEENVGESQFSCVAGVHSKTFSFYAQRPCAFWVEVNVSWLDEQAHSGNLKYFVLNTHRPVMNTPGFGNVLPDGTLGPEVDPSNVWLVNHYDKYEWLKENTVDITEKVGLPDSSYFKVYSLIESKE